MAWMHGAERNVAQLELTKRWVRVNRRTEMDRDRCCPEDAASYVNRRKRYCTQRKKKTKAGERQSRTER